MAQNVEKQVVSEIFKLGCTNQTNAANAYQVYMDLIEVKRYYNVDFHYNDQLQLVYLTANRDKNSMCSVFVPISALGSISVNNMQSVLDVCGKDGKTVYLVLVSPDSTVAYYQISEGLDAVVDFNAMDTKSATGSRVDNELKKRYDEIKLAAFTNNKR